MIDWLYCKIENNSNWFSSLFVLTGRSRSSLDWHARVKIASGAARGLRYLHEDCRVGCIVHRDMRPNNILVTHDFEPLVLFIHHGFSLTSFWYTVLSVSSQLIVKTLEGKWEPSFTLFPLFIKFESFALSKARIPWSNKRWATWQYFFFFH